MMRFMHVLPYRHTTKQETKTDRERYEWLGRWMLDNEILEHKGETYRELRNWLLRSGCAQHIKLSKSEGDPFVIGTDFYGETFEAAVDAARLVAKRKAFTASLPYCASVIPR
jgi:hypothetical protein